MIYRWRFTPDKISKHIYLLTPLIVFVLVFTVCEQLPQQADNPDNPLDPNNPEKQIEVPALVISPVKTAISASDRFDLELWVLEAEKVVGIQTKIEFDPLVLKVEEVDSLVASNESFLLQNGGQLVWLSEVNNNLGYVQIDCAVAEASPAEVAGTGIISRITFQHLSGSASQVIVSEESELRDGVNTGIAPKELVGAKVIIK